MSDVDDHDYGSELADEDFLEAVSIAEAPHPHSTGNRLRQTTFFGNTLDHTNVDSPTRPTRPYRGEQTQEPPTHHKLNAEAMKTWVYPTNLGDIRDYQYSIVKSSLFHNTLVALPTGLGKTFIAATVMLNFYRWTEQAQIVFMAPTKPLVAQQIDACFHIAGIPRSDTTLLTGETSPAVRAQEWENKRVFFTTPQTMSNDLSRGIADPKKLALLVIDEAHRATGDYAYVKVVTFLRRFNSSFRVLALTATPASTIEGVQAIIDNLGIAQVEIRTEESIDIVRYVHHCEQELVCVEPSEELLEVQDLMSQALQPLLNILSRQNIYWGREPMAITTFGLRQRAQEWASGPGKHANQSLKHMLMAVFATLQSIAHSIKLLLYHGIRPFYAIMKEMRAEVEAAGNKAPKYKKQVVTHAGFQQMMKLLDAWVLKDDFISHPKIEHLVDRVLRHFEAHNNNHAGNSVGADKKSSTRIIIFSEYRDSAEDIVSVLDRHKPLVRASVFVGQADSKRSEGMNQKTQLETIRRFTSGDINVIVATSIGEEGLDIGQVDLIICYDASSSPIRMLQRMGRTGRKRAGKVVLLVMNGKEKDNFNSAKEKYASVQRDICNGSKFDFRYDISRRIIPLDAYRNIKVDKRAVDIPVENSQTTDLPEPGKQRRIRAPKMPPKKFHMPDGVEIGFQKASVLGQTTISKPVTSVEENFTVDPPPLSKVLLNETEQKRFKEAYKYLPYDAGCKEDIEPPSLTKFPQHQRSLQSTEMVGHGAFTKRCVKLFAKLADLTNQTDMYHKPYGEEDRSNWRAIHFPPWSDEEDQSDGEDSVHPVLRNQQLATSSDHNNGFEDCFRNGNIPPGAKRGRTAEESFSADDLNSKELRKTRGFGLRKDDSQAILSPPAVRQQLMKANASTSAPGLRGKFISHAPTSNTSIQSTKQIKAAARKASAVRSKQRRAAETDDSEQGHDDVSSSPGRRPQDGRPRAKHKAKSSRTPAAKRRRLNSAGEDYGDSCMRSDDLVISSDGSDDASDLEDFIVGDDVNSSALRVEDAGDMPPSSSLPTSSLPVRDDHELGQGKTNMTHNRNHNHNHAKDDTDDNGDEDELPSLSQVVQIDVNKHAGAANPKGAPKPRKTTQEGRKKKNAAVKPNPAARRKRIAILDSDDED